MPVQNPAGPQKNEDAAKATADVQEVGPPPEESPVDPKAERLLKYVAAEGSHRQVSRAEFGEAGIDNDAVVWGPANGLCVVVKNGKDGTLSDAAAKRLLKETTSKGQPEFQLIEAK